MDLLSLIRAPNPTKVKTGSRPRAAHEVSLLTVTANRVIEMKDPATATDSSRVPSTIERSPLDFANENPSQQSTRPKNQEATALKVPPPENVTTSGVAPDVGQAEGVASMGPHMVKELRKRGHDGVDTNAPPKVLRRDHADLRPTESTRGGKSLAAIELGMGSTRPVPASQGAPVDVSDPDPLSFADPPSRPSADVTQNKRIQARENEINNLETLLEAEIDIKKAAENWSAELSKELENIRALFSYLQVINNRLSQQVSTLQAQVMGEEKVKAAFEEFKQYEDNQAEQRCVKMDARLDALSIYFDEELYPHMLTAIAGRSKDFFADLERNLFRLANFPLRLWTSLIVRDDGSCSTADVLSGYGFIPSGVTTYPKNTPFATPNVHFLGLSFMLIFRNVRNVSSISLSI
nr:hypothetical protein [Tanacetum cinerariifolium]